MERRNTALEEARGYPLPGVMLPLEDWMILELDKLLATQEALESVRERARGKRETVTFFLGLLVIYLIVVAVVSMLT